MTFLIHSGGCGGKPRTHFFWIERYSLKLKRQSEINPFRELQTFPSFELKSIRMQLVGKIF